MILSLNDLYRLIFGYAPFQSLDNSPFIFTTNDNDTFEILLKDHNTDFGKLIKVGDQYQWVPPSDCSLTELALSDILHLVLDLNQRSKRESALDELTQLSQLSGDYD